MSVITRNHKEYIPSSRANPPLPSSNPQSSRVGIFLSPRVSTSLSSKVRGPSTISASSSSSLSSKVRGPSTISASSSSSLSSSTSQAVSRVFSSTVISSEDAGTRLQEAQAKEQAAYAAREQGLATIEDLKQDGGLGKSFEQMCLNDINKKFNKAMAAIRSEYADIGFEPGTRITQS